MDFLFGFAGNFILTFTEILYSINFLALKKRRRYNTCHVAKAIKHNILKTLKYNTLEFVDSINKINRIVCKILNSRK